MSSDSNRWFKLRVEDFEEAKQFFVSNDIFPHWANGIFDQRSKLKPSFVQLLANEPILLNFENDYDFSLMVLTFGGRIDFGVGDDRRF